jgi:type I restriction enzyme, S subunit
MSELPEGWVETTIGECLAVRYGKAAPRGVGGGPVPVVASSGEIRRTSEFITSGNTLIVGRKGGVGRVQLCRGPVWPTDTTYFIAVPPEFSADFLYYQLCALQLERLDRSTAVPSLQRSDFETAPLRIAPAAEQDRIVAALETQLSRLHAAVLNLERVEKNLKRMRSAVFQRTARHCSTSRQVPIANTIRIVDYRGRTPPFSDEGIPHLRSFNVKNGKVSWEGCAYVAPETYDKYMSRGFPEPGDLLFTTEAPMGEVAFAPETKFCMAQRMMLLKPDKDVWLPEYLMYHLRSPWFQAKLRLGATGTTVQGISSRNFRPLTLSTPPLEEQAQLVSIIRDELASAEEIERVVEVQLARVRRLRASLLIAAFAGCLVPQDAADEPAALLMNRVADGSCLSRGPKAKTRRQKETA